jgi:hypothetical protein
MNTITSDDHDFTYSPRLPIRRSGEDSGYSCGFRGSYSCGAAGEFSERLMVEGQGIELAFILLTSTFILFRVTPFPYIRLRLIRLALMTS